MTINKYTVAKNDNIYEAFPDVVLTNNNNLAVVFLECTHHNDRSYTRIMMARSFNKGKNWTKKEQFTKASYDSEQSWNCPRISKLKTGEIIVVVDKVSIKNTSKPKNYYWIGNEDAEQFKGPYLLPANGIVPDKLVETINGRWIVSTHNKENNYASQKLWYSDDKGKTWSKQIIVAKKEGLNLCEGNIVEIKENVLVCFLRENSNLGLDGYKTISYDNGITWEGPYKMPIPACHRPVGGKLASGMYMITHRYMQGGKLLTGKVAQNIFAGFIDEQSIMSKKRDEQSCRIFPIDFDRSKVADIGYSGWVQFKDGTIYVVYYLVDDSPNGQIRAISFNENDVIIGGFKE